MPLLRSSLGVTIAFALSATACAEPSPTMLDTPPPDLVASAEGIAVGPSVYGMGRLNRNPPGGACQSADHRAFDFWAGTWDVFGPQGGLGGTNAIIPQLGGCFLEEGWTGAGGFRGRSMNAYDAATGSWTQYWIDQGGTHLRLTGAWDGSVMTMSGPRIAFPPSGPITIIDRIRWTPATDGTVNQFWDISLDDGATFPIVAFNGTYVPNPNIQPAPSGTGGRCTTSPSYRELDFFIGTWVVRTKQGRELGSSTVAGDLDGCLIEEDFSTPKGYASQSFFGWDFRTQRWYRNLMDTDGTRLVLEGEFDGNRLVLEGTRSTPGGSVALRQVMEPEGPDRIVQSWFERPANGQWRPAGEVVFER